MPRTKKLGPVYRKKRTPVKSWGCDDKNINDKIKFKNGKTVQCMGDHTHKIKWRKDNGYKVKQQGKMYIGTISPNQRANKEKWRAFK